MIFDEGIFFCFNGVQRLRMDAGKPVLGEMGDHTLLAAL